MFFRENRYLWNNQVEFMKKWLKKWYTAPVLEIVDDYIIEIVDDYIIVIKLH
jgi:hypothetical protein